MHKTGHYLFCACPILCVRTLPVPSTPHYLCQDITCSAHTPFSDQDITCSMHTPFSLSGHYLDNSTHTPFSVSGHYLFYPHPILCIRTLPVLPTTHSLYQDITCSTHTLFSVSGLHTIDSILCVRTLLVLYTPHSVCQDITCSTHTAFSVSGHYLFYPHRIICIRTLPVLPTPHSLYQDSTQSWSCPCWLTADAMADSILHLLHTRQDIS